MHNTTKLPLDKPIPDEELVPNLNETKCCIVLWLKSDRASINEHKHYISMPFSKAEAYDLAQMLENRQLHEFFPLPLHSLNGEIMNFSRHDISSYVVRKWEQ